MTPELSPLPSSAMLENRRAIAQAVEDVAKLRMWFFRVRIKRLGLQPSGLVCCYPQVDHDDHVRRWLLFVRRQAREVRERAERERYWNRQAELRRKAQDGELWWGDVVYENGTDRIVSVRNGRSR